MSVESQTAGKHDSGNPEVEIPDEHEKSVNAFEKYLFLKDDFGSVSSASDNHSELFLSKSKAEFDCGGSSQVTMI